MPEVVVNVLHEDGTPKTPEEVEGERQVIIDRGDTPIVPGSKTDSALLLKSLQDERAQRKVLEDKIILLEESLANPDITTDEGRALQKQIEESKSLIANLTSDLAKKDILIAHPVLTDQWTDFEKFRSDPENAGMPLKVAAKAFLAEKGLLDPVRKGLEKPTGGPRTPISTEMSADEIKTLRETNFKKYQELLEKGLIKV